jgi:hypothetical protein
MKKESIRFILLIFWPSLQAVSSATLGAVAARTLLSSCDPA